jgi:hypothetical protein
VARMRIWSEWFIDLHYHSRSQKTMLVPYREFVSLVITSILMVIWF